MRAAHLLALTIGLVGCAGTASESSSLSPALLAQGNFATGVGEVVELEATGEGSSVTGRMTVSEPSYAFAVDLHCTQTTEDGLIMIGGITTDTAGGGSALSPVGTWAGIVLQRGSPVGASIWSQRGGPTSQATSCLAFLHEQDRWERLTHPGADTVPRGDWTDPIEGTVELGP